MKPLNDIPLSPSFRLAEFACPCCKTVKIQPELLQKLQQLRDGWGEPVIITSGYRCFDHNAEVGGIEGSDHTRGRAADIAVAAVWQPKVIALAQTVGFGKILPYPRRNFIHLAL
ncbi:YcbK family protein [Aminirod propionatiphilus]|uniref:DUF882 domain-containing protein n=1 Tax=Aminirod propionatiphilus TaxID=3415223 RepID=A0ACD1DUC5_9BACT|nr:DUF882 domain-containing protein [Synergistota bacterium]